MSHQAFPKPTGTTTDGYVLTYSSTDGYWKPKSLPATGWQTVYDVDFSSLPTQSFSGNGTVSIDSKNWTVENFAAATSFGIVNGQGLVFTCNTNSTDYNNGTRNGLILSTKISNIYPQFSLTEHRVRITAYVSSNADQNFEFLVFGFEDSDSPTSFNYTLFRGYQNGGMLAQKATLNGGSAANLDTSNPTDDVLQLTACLPTHVEMNTGVYSGGFPSQDSLRQRRVYLRANDFTPSVTNSQDLGVVFSAITNNANGNLVANVIRFKVEIFIPGNGNILGSAGGNLSGTYPNPTVAKIQNIPVNSASPSDGQLLTYVSADGYWAPRDSANSSSRYIATDSNTIINWKFDETSAPYINSGSGSTLSLTTFTGTPVSVTGIFGKGLGCSASTLTTGNTSVNEPSGTSVTVSAWVKARTFSTFATVVNKSYRNNNSWVSPFVSLYLSLSNSGDGSWGPAITTTGGVLTQPIIGGAFRVPLYEWTLLSFTYDGSALRSYINGALANTTNVAGAIDYGTHGPWDVGGVSNASVGQFWDGHIDDVRVESVVRSQAYFEEMYKRGIGRPD